ncbi:MAG TPA: carbonic anhydrase, partial [Desulfuromonadaceae bacterium]|nr:carbonic anhydrase [Desulfuromonadaceae bacterium]
MRLFEAIIDANHRAVAGDKEAGLHPDDFAAELPVVALTCIDPRLNGYFPNALALPAEQFIWLRNAGNIITSPLSSTMRSLSLACAVKGGREIAIIGHTDCQVCKTTTMVLLDKLKALGVDRSQLPDNLNEFFGLFSSERQNVIKACDLVRQSPLIGPKIPVHGLLIDVESGKLDWVVNGYQATAMQSQAGNFPPLSALNSLKSFDMGEMKFPDTKIGELASKAA